NKYYPTGKRNYARVITTDDFQGSAAAQFASQDLKLKNCYVLNDNQTYGQGVANAFADEAKKQGINILGNTAWDAKQPNYTALYGVAAVQVILKAIEGSDGTRKSVTSQVFGGSGITIPANDAVLGKDIKIDAKTGDTNAVDISVLQLMNNQEGFLKAWKLK